jgi:putative ABC transport system substrate-binding protein
VRVAQIGVLRAGAPPDPFVEAFRQGLRELGYVEGRNINLVYRWAEGKGDHLPELAVDLVRLKVDVIVASGHATAAAAKRATTAIPIGMPASTDPVGIGLVKGLAHPGGNITGIVILNEEMPGKWMELLKEALPKLTRVAVLWDDTSSRDQLKASEEAARTLNMNLQALKANRPDDLLTAFAEAQHRRAEGLIVLAPSFLWAHRTRVVELAAKHRLPTIYHQGDFVVGSGAPGDGSARRRA